MIALEVVKDYLGITDTSQDEALEGLIARLGAVLTRKLGWWFGEPRATEEILDGLGTPQLYLRQPPVLSGVMVVEVYERSDIGQPWVLISGDDYEVDGRILHHVHCWARGRRNYKVEYHEGFDAVPGDIQQLLLEFIESRVVTEAQASAVKSEKLGDYSYTLADDSVLSRDIESSPLWLNTINTYRRARI